MRHILVVDDDINFRRSLVIQLELEGFVISEVESASDAFRFLKKCEDQGHFPDLVITDMKMPEMNGGEFVQRLHQIYKKLPVIVISAFDLPEMLQGYPFLRKPFKIQDIKRSIDETNIQSFPYSNYHEKV